MSKSSKKKTGFASRQPSLNVEKYIREAARKLQFYKVWAVPGWEHYGATNIVVARQRPNGGLVVGFFHVDLWCCGVDDCAYLMHDDIESFEQEIDPSFELIDPVWLKISFSEPLSMPKI